MRAAASSTLPTLSTPRSSSISAASYTLTLDEDGMNALSAAITPGLRTQNVSFTSGCIEALVGADGTLRSVSISCSGALHLILSDAPASLSAVITPAEREFAIPQPALNALKQ